VAVSLKKTTADLHVRSAVSPSAKFLAVEHLNTMRLKRLLPTKKLVRSKDLEARWVAHLPPLSN